MANRAAQKHDGDDIVFGDFFRRPDGRCDGGRGQRFNPRPNRRYLIVREVCLARRHLAIANHLVKPALVRLAGRDNRTGFAALHHAVKRAEIHFFDAGISAVATGTLCGQNRLDIGFESDSLSGRTGGGGRSFRLSRGLSRRQSAHATLEPQIEIGIVALQIVFVALDQKLGVLQILRLQHLHIDATEQFGGVRGDFRNRRMVIAVLEVEEVEIELDRALHLSRVRIAVTPVERVDGCVVAPVDAVLEIPCELLASPRVGRIRFLGEWPTGHVAFDLAVLGPQLDLGGIFPRCLDVSLCIREVDGRINTGLVPAFLDHLVVGRIEHLLELFDVGLADDRPGSKARKARKTALVGVERQVHVGVCQRMGGTRETCCHEWQQ